MPAVASHSLLVLLSTLIAYLLGGLPFGYWFVRLITGQDIRTMGSGNIGATNVHRTTGGRAGLMVLVLDILKGFVAVWVAGQLTGDDPVGLACSALAVMLGHCYPIFLGFKGGKAVACFVGAFLYLAPLALAVITVVFFATLAISKHISLGSILGAIVFPFAFAVTYAPPRALLLSAIASSLLVIVRHRSNIDRLRRGEERVFSLKSGRTA